MSADVCVCGHLLQGHRDWPYGGSCHCPACVCPRFVSEDPPVQMILVVEEILVVEQLVVVAA